MSGKAGSENPTVDPLQKELGYKENLTKYRAVCPESLVAMLEYWFIEGRVTLWSGRSLATDRCHSLFPGGYYQKNWVGVCGPLPKTLSLFTNKISDIPYPIYDLTKNSKPNRPFAAKPSRDLHFIKLWVATLTMPEMEKSMSKTSKRPNCGHLTPAAKGPFMTRPPHQIPVSDPHYN